MAGSIERTRVDGHAVNGKCVIKATMDMSINQLSSFGKDGDMAHFKKVTSKKMTLEAVSTENLREYLGMEVILEPHLKETLGEYRIALPTNPKSVARYVELLKGTKGKYVNELIEKRVIVEIWEYYSVFESDLRFVIDSNLKIQSEGYLIPELHDLLESGKLESAPDEISMLDVDLTNTKAKGDVVERVILPERTNDIPISNE